MLKYLITGLLLLGLIPPAFSKERVIQEFTPTDTIEDINSKIKNNGYNFKVEHNWVYDMPLNEKKEFFSRKKPEVPDYSKEGDFGPLAEITGTVALPASFDWRNVNGRSYIGEVRNQGGCGACYAFGAAAAAEGSYNIAKNFYDASCADFSEAFIAFCLRSYYSGFNGCSGSDYNFNELQALVDYGIPDEYAYPYSDDRFQECLSSSWNGYRVKFKSWHRIPCGDITAIKTAIYTFGVVDASVLVTSAFEAYGGGIYEDTNISCGGTPCYYTDTDHGVALVGWNDNGDPDNEGYWILRNSWGEYWGEAGYMKIKYKSAAVSCETAYLVYESNPVEPTPSPSPSPTPSPTPTPTPSGYYPSTFSSPLIIPDGNPAGLSNTIFITDIGRILDLNVGIEIDHPWVGDISVELQNLSSGKKAVLIDRPKYPELPYGCSGKGIYAVLDDEADFFIEDVCGSGTPGISGTYKPNEPLAFFNYSSLSGAWSINVKDSTTLDIGALLKWFLIIKSTNQSLDVSKNWEIYE